MSACQLKLRWWITLPQNSYRRKQCFSFPKFSLKYISSTYWLEISKTGIRIFAKLKYRLIRCNGQWNFHWCLKSAYSFFSDTSVDDLACSPLRSCLRMTASCKQFVSSENNSWKLRIRTSCGKVGNGLRTKSLEGQTEWNKRGVRELEVIPEGLTCLRESYIVVLQRITLKGSFYVKIQWCHQARIWA